MTRVNRTVYRSRTGSDLVSCDSKGIKVHAYEVSRDELAELLEAVTDVLEHLAEKDEPKPPLPTTSREGD